tara:strand:- start:32 stop:640 length:609 start_codon:yes stop_codon:yes gene_type:complete
MACDLTLGRKEPCKKVVGGIKEVYFVSFGNLTNVGYDSVDTDVINTISESALAYRYEVRGSSSFTQNIQTSRQNSSTSFEQVLELSLKKLSKEDNREIKKMSSGRFHVFVIDYNNNIFVAGLDNGLQVTDGNIFTGSALTEFSGYKITLRGEERTPANFLGNSIDSLGFIVNLSEDGVQFMERVQLDNGEIVSISCVNKINN